MTMIEEQQLTQIAQANFHKEILRQDAIEYVLDTYHPNYRTYTKQQFLNIVELVQWEAAKRSLCASHRDLQNKNVARLMAREVQQIRQADVIDFWTIAQQNNN